MKRLVILICVIYIASLTACSDSNKDSDSEKTVTALAAYMAAISKIWEKKTIADLSGPFLHLCDSYAGKEPSCSNCPGTNPEFAFFVKRGDPTKLMVFFMGGGACWSITNCVYNHTYSEDLFESVMLLGLVSSGAGKSRGAGGFIDTTNPDNPFRDWTIVYVPYCTGDLGAGQKDKDYMDDYSPEPIPNVTIRHRGAVNLSLVVQWMRENIPSAAVTHLFVTGLSAGSYASLLAFPYIRTEYSAATTACYLGDAGVGFTPATDAWGNTFTDIANVNWGVVLPVDVFGTTDISTFPTYKELVYAGVNHYLGAATGERFAQYTTKYDKTQTWFYNIQVEDHINYPNFWGSESGADPDLWVYQDWSDGMYDDSGTTGAIQIELPNYAYYIGAGTDHTIIFYNKTYTETSGGTSFVGWVDSLVNGAMPASTACSEPNCGALF
ncbi:MAG TPA: pectin acetylesterase-family hydrolase [Spirochaetota bacterium]|nr:pectin acetylesterase-family hydrolase [Spirochaetota bacterium]